MNSERRHDVRFFNRDVQLSGTLITPTTPGPHPAIILVHSSGAEDSSCLLPAALCPFSIRHGVAVLGYDKRGVGASTGDWNTASFNDLAGDVVAAFDYLKTRRDIQSAPRLACWGGVKRVGLCHWQRGVPKTWHFSSALLARASLAPRPRWTKPGARCPRRVCGRRWSARLSSSWHCRTSTCAQAKDGTDTWRHVRESPLVWEEIRPKRFPQHRTIPICVSFDRSSPL